MHDGTDHETAPVIARLEAAAPRRAIGAVMVLALGALLLYLVALYPPAVIGWRFFLLALGLCALWLGVRLWHSTSVALELTSHELREEGGRRLALISEVTSVARGVFAFKPSNGFTLTLSTGGPFVWAPGLWWRIGRRVGVGGVTPRNASRFMAETIDMRISARSSVGKEHDDATP